MSKRNDKTRDDRRYAAGIATEIAFTLAIFVAAFIIIILFNLIIR